MDTYLSIQLSGAGKRYNREWVFRDLHYRFEAGKSYAVVGQNGSGKSTLLQVIAGFLPLSEGKINLTRGKAMFEADSFYRFIAWATPYMEIPEDLSLPELIDFQSKFMGFSVPAQEIPELIGLGHARQKQIKYYSTGMRQKAKLALALYSDAPVLLLDEPTSNLDKKNSQWYLDLMQRISSDKRLVVVCSNQPDEYGFCQELIQMNDYKNKP